MVYHSSSVIVYLVMADTPILELRIGLLTSVGLHKEAATVTLNFKDVDGMLRKIYVLS